MLINGLGYENLIEYVLNNSTLAADQFTFAAKGGDGYSSFIVAQKDKLLSLGTFSYDRFIRVEWGQTKADAFAITAFLDLCIKKIEDPTIVIPRLTGNPDMWAACYKE